MHIRPLLRSDIAQLATIALNALKEDLLYNYLFPGLQQHSDDFLRFQTINLRTRLVRPGFHGFVVVSDGNEIMGYALYQRVPRSDAEKDKQVKQSIQDTWLNKIERYLLSWELYYYNFFNKALDQNRASRYTGESKSARAFYKDISPYWHLSFLAVAPQYQRRGVGKLLVCEGQRLALSDQIPLVLESSPVGRRLYENNGFRNLWEGEICGMKDLSMIWQPDVQAEYEGKKQVPIQIR